MQGLRALRALADQVAMMQSSSSVTTERVNVDVTTVFVSVAPCILMPLVASRVMLLADIRFTFAINPKSRP